MTTLTRTSALPPATPETANPTLPKAKESNPGADPIPPGSWTITLEAAGVGPPLTVRIRRALKGLLRGYGLRCVSATALIPESAKEPADRTVLKKSA